MQVHKNLAFDKGRDRNSTKHNKALNAIMTGMASYVDGPLKEAWRDEAKQIYATAIENGETANFDYKTFEDFSLASKTSDYDLLSKTSINLEQLAKIKKRIDLEPFNPAVKAVLNAQINQDESRIKVEYGNAIGRYILSKDEEIFNDPKKYKVYYDSIKKGTIINTVNDDGQAITINTGKLQVGTLRTILSNLNVMQSAYKSEDLNQKINAATKVSQTMSLSKLTETIKGLNDGTLNKEITDSGARKAILSVYESAKKQRSNEDLVIAGANIKNIEASLISNNGIIDEQTQSLIKKTNAIFNLSENDEQSENFNMLLKINSESNTIWKTIQFLSPSDEASELQKAKKNIEEAPIEDKYKTQEIYKNLVARFSKQKNDLAKDAVGYLQTQMNKTLEPEERIAKQKTLGVLNNDIKIYSNAELDVFKGEYSNAENLTEKGNIGLAFIKKFGIDNQNLVMKNLVTSGTISKVESLFLSDPDNTNKQYMLTANSKEAIKGYEGNVKFTKQMNSDLLKEAKVALSNYRSSLVGKGYGGEGEPALTTSAHAHLAKTEEIIANTAKLLMTEGEVNKSAAITRAYEMALGDSHEFVEINNKQIRFEKSDGFDTNGIKNALQFMIKDKNSLLQIVVSAEKAGMTKEVSSEKYIDEIISDGGWRTTVDGKSAFLIDGTGNMVRRKPREGPGSNVDMSGGNLIDPASPFIVINFKDINNISIGVNEIKNKYTEILGMRSNIIGMNKEIEEYYKQMAIF